VPNERPFILRLCGCRRYAIVEDQDSGELPHPKLPCKAGKSFRGLTNFEL